jgi:hypothetical protein
MTEKDKALLEFPFTVTGNAAIMTALSHLWFCPERNIGEGYQGER